VTSIDREGTGLGYDLELIRKISQAVSVPVIACGGAGKVADVVAAAIEGKADAVSMASILHYPLSQQFRHEGVEFGSGGEFPILTERRAISRIQGASLSEVKDGLRKNGVQCRAPVAVGRGGIQVITL
jgi:imidazole glycerol-phosphate synthase subunit HisF